MYHLSTKTSHCTLRDTVVTMYPSLQNGHEVHFVYLHGISSEHERMIYQNEQLSRSELCLWSF